MYARLIVLRTHAVSSYFLTLRDTFHEHAATTSHFKTLIRPVLLNETDADILKNTVTRIEERYENSPIHGI